MSINDTRLPLSDVTESVIDLLAKFNGSDGAEWLQGFKQFLRRENPWEKSSSENLDLLEFVSEFETTSSKDTFQANSCFVINNTRGVKFSYIGDKFKKHFLGKSEQNVHSCVLKVFRLKKACGDVPIMEILGENYEINLSDLWELLEKHPKGEKGILLTNGYANIFYMYDANGVLWAVRVGWSAGWRVDAYSVGDQCGWDSHEQVFSANALSL